MARVFRKNAAYWIDYNDAGGVRHRRKVSSTKRIAVEALKVIEGKVAAEEFGLPERAAISFAAFATKWRKSVEPRLKPGTASRWRGIVENHLKPAFRGRAAWRE